MIILGPTFCWLSILVRFGLGLVLCSFPPGGIAFFVFGADVSGRGVGPRLLLAFLFAAVSSFFAALLDG